MPNNNGDITFKYGTQEAYNGLSSIDENAIYITTDTHRIYIGGADYTDDTQMNNATKQYVDSKAETINSQISNIIAHNNDTEGNTELVDIRTGVDGTVYTSAGLAVRTQITNVNQVSMEQRKDIIDLCGHIYYHSYVFGTINSSNNEDVNSGKTRIRTDSPIPFENGMRIQFTAVTRPTMFVFLNSSNQRIGSTTYITSQNIKLDDYAPDNTAYFRFLIKYDDAGTQKFTDAELSNLSSEIKIIMKSLADDILENKSSLAKKVGVEKIGIAIASETSGYAKGTDLSSFTSFASDPNRFVSDFDISKECFLTAISVPQNASTACRVICGKVENNTFSLHHDYGSFNITNGQAQINDTSYMLKPGERIFLRFSGGFHYKAQRNTCIFLTQNMNYSTTEQYIIGYDLILTNTEYSTEWIRNCADMVGSFKGKNYVAYGDSITAGYGLDGYEENQQFNNTSVNVYSKLLADDLKMNYFNYGYSAHGYSVTPNYTFVDLIERHHTDADIVTVAMGTNDYGLASTYNIPFGTISDTTTATFCGSVRASYDKLLEYYPKAEIIIILPLPRSNMTANAQGKTLYDYADVIKQIAGEYGFPVVDLLRAGNVHHKSTVFMNDYSMDGLHWNESFHKEYIYHQLKNAVINAEIST